jgi:hypothetical protein
MNRDDCKKLSWHDHIAEATARAAKVPDVDEKKMLEVDLTVLVPKPE